METEWTWVYIPQEIEDEVAPEDIKEREGKIVVCLCKERIFFMPDENMTEKTCKWCGRVYRLEGWRVVEVRN